MTLIRISCQLAHISTNRIGGMPVVSNHSMSHRIWKDVEMNTVPTGEPLNPVEDVMTKQLPNSFPWIPLWINKLNNPSQPMTQMYKQLVTVGCQILSAPLASIFTTRLCRFGMPRIPYGVVDQQIVFPNIWQEQQLAIIVWTPAQTWRPGTPIEEEHPVQLPNSYYGTWNIFGDLECNAASYLRSDMTRQHTYTNMWGPLSWISTHHRPRATIWASWGALSAITRNAIGGPERSVKWNGLTLHECKHTDNIYTPLS